VVTLLENLVQREPKILNVHKLGPVNFEEPDKQPLQWQILMGQEFINLRL
jgi:hypothetical protein